MQSLLTRFESRPVLFLDCVRCRLPALPQGLRMSNDVWNMHDGLQQFFRRARKGNQGSAKPATRTRPHQHP